MASASTGRCGKYFLLRSLQNRELVAEIQNAADQPGTRVVLDHARIEEEGNKHQLWCKDNDTGSIRSKLNGFCLDVKDDVVVVNPYRRSRETQNLVCSGDKIQSQWDFEMVVGIEGGQDIPGTGLLLQQQEGELSECWSFEHRPPEYFLIRSHDHGMVLDVEKANPRPGATVILYKDHGRTADNQLWYEDENGIIKSKLNHFTFDSKGKKIVLNPYSEKINDMQWIRVDNTIRNRINRNLVLEIETLAIDKLPRFAKFSKKIAGAFGDHPDILISEFTGNLNQLWQFDPLSASGANLTHGGNGKHFLARNRCNGMVLELQGGNIEPGTPVVMSFKNFDNRNMDHQLFYEDVSTHTIRSSLNQLCLQIDDGTVITSQYNHSNENQKLLVWGKRIQSEMNPDHVLEVEPEVVETGSYVSIGTYSGEEHQQWEIAYQPAKVFYIKSLLNGKCMTVHKANSSPGAQVVMWQRVDHPAPNQLWYEDERGILRSKLNGYVLDSSQDLRLHPYNPSVPDQHWQISNDSIVNTLLPGNVLDIAGGNTRKGAKIIAFRAHGGTNQKWTFDPV